MEKKHIEELGKVPSNGPDCTYQLIKTKPVIVLNGRPRKVDAKQRSKWAILKMCGLLILGTLFFINLTAFIVYWGTNAVESYMMQDLALKNNSVHYLWWIKQPATPLFQIRIFNYTNVERFLAGDDDKLKVEEIGPYSYRETLERVNVEFHDNDTVSYQEHRSYEFAPNDTVGDLDDIVVIPSLTYLSTLSRMKYSTYLMRLTMSTMLLTLKVQPFLTLKVNDALWGYDDPLYDLGKRFEHGNNPAMPESSGILVKLKGTSSKVITIRTGVPDLKQLGLIDSYGGKSKLDLWSTEKCNRIDVTDGNMFPEYLMREDSVLEVYMPDLCRKFPFVFKEHEMAVTGVPAMRFEPAPDVFDTAETNPDNACFCDPSSSCPPAGVFNASLCSFNAPIMFSFPHFYLGDPVLLDMVDGLKPNATKHGMFIDLQEFGLPVGGETRIQANLFVRKPSASYIGSLKEGTILPLAWFEKIGDGLPDEVVYALLTLSFITRTVKRYVLISFLLTLQVVLIILFIYGYRRYRNKKEKPVLIQDQYRQVAYVTTADESLLQNKTNSLRVKSLRVKLEENAL